MKTDLISDSLGRGWQVSQVAQALMIDRESVRNHHKRYRKGGLMALLRHDAGGSEAALNSEQRQQLAEYLQSHLCLAAKQVAHYVQQTWQVSYSESGITQLLHRLGFVYRPWFWRSMSRPTNFVIAISPAWLLMC